MLKEEKRGGGGEGVRRLRERVEGGLGLVLGLLWRGSGRDFVDRWGGDGGSRIKLRHSASVVSYHSCELSLRTSTSRMLRWAVTPPPTAGTKSLVVLHALAGLTVNYLCQSSHRFWISKVGKPVIPDQSPNSCKSPSPPSSAPHCHRSASQAIEGVRGD